jgi:hypothetical protein
VVVLDDDGALAQPLELLRIEGHGPITDVALREEQLRRPPGAGLPLQHLVDLTLPAAAEPAVHDVLAADDATRVQVERLDLLQNGGHHPRRR